MVLENALRRDAILKAARSIFSQLQLDPLAIGNPLYHLHHLGLLVCVAAAKPIAVHYAVDDVRKIVYLKNIILMAGSKS